MIELGNNKLLEEPIIDVLYDLRRDLIKHNISKLDKIIIKGPNALITCPIHKGGHENKPSCYVRLEENTKVNEGIVHCFTCGYKASLPVFISNCFDYDDEGMYGRKWLLDKCEYSYLTEKRELNKITTLNQKRQEVNLNYVSEQELASYRYYHPYMFKRKLTEEIINKFDIGFDKKTNCITFPVYDRNNKCLFVVKRNINFKKFYIPPNVDKGIFGLNQIPLNCKEVIVCESVFNALTCWVYGYPAIALFGTGSEYQYNILRKSNIRSFVLCFDGDSAGRKGAKNFKNSLGNSFLITTMIMPEHKDVNDLSKEEFEKIYNNRINISV